MVAVVYYSRSRREGQGQGLSAAGSVASGASSRTSYHNQQRQAWGKRGSDSSVGDECPPLDVVIKLVNSQELGALEFAAESVLALQAYAPPATDRGCGVFTAQTVRDRRGERCAEGQQHDNRHYLRQHPPAADQP